MVTKLATYSTPLTVIEHAERCSSEPLLSAASGRARSFSAAKAVSLPFADYRQAR